MRRENGPGSSDPMHCVGPGTGRFFFWDRVGSLDLVACSVMRMVWSELFPLSTLITDPLWGFDASCGNESCLSWRVLNVIGPCSVVAGAAISDQRLLRDPVDVQDRSNCWPSCATRRTGRLAGGCPTCVPLAEKGDLSSQFFTFRCCGFHVVRLSEENGMHAVVEMLEPLAT